MSPEPTTIKLAFASSCEMDMGISDNADFVTLDASFLQEFSSVVWAGSLTPRSKSFS